MESFINGAIIRIKKHTNFSVHNLTDIFVKINSSVFLCMSPKPVSYTHLDVYKRQEVA